MADKKISELTSITGANTAADDYFVVVDTSGAVTYKISREELNNAIEQDVLSSIEITDITNDVNVQGTVTADGLTVDGTSQFNTGRTFVTGGDEPYVLGVGRNGNTNSYYLGVHSSTTPDLIFSNNAGTENVRFTYGGSVGIGTSSPDAPFTIQRPSNNQGIAAGLSLKGQDGTTQGGLGTDGVNDNAVQLVAAQFIKFHTNNTDGTANERLRIDSNGNVGIGAVPSGQRLLLADTSANAVNIQLQNNAASNLFIGADTTNLVFYNGGSERLRITSAGTVLTGKTAEGTATDGIELNRNNVLVATRNNDAPMLLNRRSSDGSIIELRKDNSAVGSIGGHTSSVVGLSVRGSSSYGGIGLPNDRNTLWPVGTTGNPTDNLMDIGSGAVRWKNLYLSGTVTANGLTVDGSGNLMVGATSPIFAGATYRAGFKASNNIMAVHRTSGNQGTAIAFINENNVVSGYIYNLTNSTSYSTTSDYRLKTAVTYDWDATTRLKQLKPARFEWIADGDDAVPVDGFLAHEVSDIVPEAITGTKDGMRDEEYEVTPAVLDEDGNEVTPAVMGTRSVPDYQGIDQSKLTPLLTKALIEAVEKIEQLETRIAALEANNG